MTYHISRIRDGRVEGEATWKGVPFETVKEHARELVDTDMADRVEVRDAEQALVFHFPRVTKPASIG